jgi:transcriptional regulator with XRE-family HTH domain
VPDFDACGALRRLRRNADLSQRELAATLGVSKSLIAAQESGERAIGVDLLVRAAALTGLRLALLDEDGHEVTAMAADAVRDLGGRRFPAHLDTRRSDEGRWPHEPRRDRPETAFTVTRDRGSRDACRRVAGVPPDHHAATPGDSPAERRTARRLRALRERSDERRRQLLAGELAGIGDGFTCTCPPACDELDDRSGRPVHAEDCRCCCDVG